MSDHDELLEAVAAFRTATNDHAQAVKARDRAQTALSDSERRVADSVVRWNQAEQRLIQASLGSTPDALKRMVRLKGPFALPEAPGHGG